MLLNNTKLPTVSMQCIIYLFLFQPLKTSILTVRLMQFRNIMYFLIYSNMKTKCTSMFAVLVFFAKVTLSFSATLSTIKQSPFTTTQLTSATGLSTETMSSSEKSRINITTSEFVDPTKEHNQTGKIQSVTEDPDLPQFRLKRMMHSIHLVWLNVDHVRYPLMFTLVVIFAALSKIGKKRFNVSDGNMVHI